MRAVPERAARFGGGLAVGDRVRVTDARDDYFGRTATIRKINGPGVWLHVDHVRPNEADKVVVLASQVERIG